MSISIFLTGLLDVMKSTWSTGDLANACCLVTLGLWKSSCGLGRFCGNTVETLGLFTFSGTQFAIITTGTNVHR